MDFLRFIGEDGNRYVIPAVKQIDEQAIYDQGKAAAEAVCAGKHFVALVKGSGTTALSFNVPFAPDEIFISGYKDGTPVANDLLCFATDISATATVAGLCQVASSGNPYVGTYGSGTLSTRYTRSDDGNVTISNLQVKPSGGSAVTAVFSSSMTYTIVAVKHS